MATSWNDRISKIEIYLLAPPAGVKRAGSDLKRPSTTVHLEALPAGDEPF